MEHEHNFYGVNFAPFPHRGVLSSENAHRSMATMVEATAANWVILSPSGIQSDPYSEEINWNTNATPTDEELCGAIRFAKQLGLAGGVEAYRQLRQRRVAGAHQLF